MLMTDLVYVCILSAQTGLAVGDVGKVRGQAILQKIALQVGAGKVVSKVYVYTHETGRGGYL